MGLLDLRHRLQAIKAALGETAKCYFEESLWDKVSLTYLDEMSQEPNYGA